jgi:signal transduction histidine kinase
MSGRGGTLTVSLRAERSFWVISFADTGDGLSPQQMEKIFEPFQSTFAGGTGLGLALVYQIVQAHEGKIAVRSSEGNGAEFVVRLRRSDAGAQIQPPLAAVVGRGPHG